MVIQYYIHTIHVTCIFVFSSHGENHDTTLTHYVCFIAYKDVVDRSQDVEDMVNTSIRLRNFSEEVLFETWQ